MVDLIILTKNIFCSPRRKSVDILQIIKWIYLGLYLRLSLRRMFLAQLVTAIQGIPTPLHSTVLPYRNVHSVKQFIGRCFLYGDPQTMEIISLKQEVSIHSDHLSHWSAPRLIQEPEWRSQEQPKSIQSSSPELSWPIFHRRSVNWNSF